MIGVLPLTMPFGAEQTKVFQPEKLCLILLLRVGVFQLGRVQHLLGQHLQRVHFLGMLHISDVHIQMILFIRLQGIGISVAGLSTSWVASAPIGLGRLMAASGTPCTSAAVSCVRRTTAVGLTACRLGALRNK